MYHMFCMKLPITKDCYSMPLDKSNVLRHLAHQEDLQSAVRMADPQAWSRQCVTHMSVQTETTLGQVKDPVSPSKGGFPVETLNAVPGHCTGRNVAKPSRVLT